MWHLPFIEIEFTKQVAADVDIKRSELCELGNCELLLFEVWFYELLPWKWFNLNFKQGCLAKVYVKVNYLLSNLFCIFQDPLMRRLERCHVVPVGQILNNSVSGSGLNHSHYTITRTGEVVQQPRGNFIKRWCIFKYRNQCIQQINQNFSNKNVYQQQKKMIFICNVLEHLFSGTFNLEPRKLMSFQDLGFPLCFSFSTFGIGVII